MVENPTRALSRVLAPESEPISLAEAKLFLRVDGSDEDELIATLISAVREAAEEYLRKSLADQRWKLTYEDYAPVVTPLPRGPVLSVVSVTRRSQSGAETAVSGEVYHLSARVDALHFETAILSHEVEIVYETGYGEEEIPASIRQGMLVHLAALYEDRQGAEGMPAATLSLYKPHREVRF